jgi:hypothetical protein
MLEEARALKHKYTAHRGNESKGWKSLALYGLDEHKHENWDHYGYATASDAAKDFRWTESAKQCPVTMDFLMNTFPSKKYGRVRFMLLESGGYIGMHSDSKSKTYLTENINIPLNNPKECIWHWGDDNSTLFMEPGRPYAMNITYDHMITNNSDQDRYHLIIARHDATPEWKELIKKSAAESNVEGRFIVINDLP